MRLTLIISSLNSGGAERVMCMLASAWSRMGRQVTILTTHDGGRKPDYPLDQNVRLISIDPGSGGLRRQIGIVRGIRRLIRSNRPDTVISFLKFTNILVLIATRGLGVPVIVSERLDPSVIGIRAHWSLLRRWTYRWTDVLVAQTETAARHFEPMAPDRVRVIPNPIFALDKEPGADDPVTLDGPSFLAVGRLHPQKGFDLLIRAMAIVRDREPDWRLIILGEGDSRTELEKDIRASGQGGCISLPGRVRNPWPWLKAADAFVMSSRCEGFPNALCEAMIAGLPVLSTDCPSGPGDLIEQDRNGLLVPVEDVSGLAEGMLRLAGSSELRSELGMRAKHIDKRFRLEMVLDLWDEIITDLIDSKTTP